MRYRALHSQSSKFSATVISPRQFAAIGEECIKKIGLDQWPCNAAHGNGWVGRKSMCTECQAFCPVVRIGSPNLLTRKRVLLPLWVQGRRHTRLGGPNPDEGTGTLVLYFWGIFQFLKLPEASCDAVMASMMIAPFEN